MQPQRRVKAISEPRDRFYFKDYKGKTAEDRMKKATEHALQHASFYDKLVQAGFIHPETRFAIDGDEESVFIAFSQPEVQAPKPGFKFEAIAKPKLAAELREIKLYKLERLKEFMEIEGVRPRGDWKHDFNWGFDGNDLYYIDAHILLEKRPFKQKKLPAALWERIAQALRTKNKK